MSNTSIDVKEFMRQYKKMNTKIPPLKTNMDYITPKEYAEILKVSVGTVQRQLSVGMIEGAIKVGNRWRIPIEKA